MDGYQKRRVWISDAALMGFGMGKFACQAGHGITGRSAMSLCGVLEFALAFLLMGFDGMFVRER